MRHRRWWIGLLALGIIVGCEKENNTAGPVPRPPTPTGAARGTITIDLSSSSGSSARGTVTVVIGTSRLVLPVDVSLATGRVLTVQYEFDSVETGRTAVFYVADITVGTENYVFAGTATISIVEGTTTLIPDSVYVPVEVDRSYTVSGNVQISTPTVSSTSVTVPYVTVSGTVSNMDIARIFIYVNGDVFPVTLNLSGGRATFSMIVALDPGVNQILVAGMNSNGVLVLSSPVTVTYTATVTGNMMLGTLIWDSPTSDIDLHLWYFTETNPTASSTFSQHCYYGDMDLEGIRPDRETDTIGNLDVDDTEGFGPEHMTLINYPDGYYVFAIHKYSMDSDSVSNCSFTLKIGTVERTVFHTFTVSSTPRYVRCFDVRVVGGVATILAPDMNILSNLSKARLPAKGN